MLYQRKLLPELEKQVKTKEIVVVTGMRRVGKTTLLKMLFDGIGAKNKVFLDMENPIEQKIFEEEDYNNIWANLKFYGISQKEKSYIFLDEIQAAPKAVRAVKYLHDHYDAKFFLTGSSSFYLKNLFPESLAGRKIVFELFPLDFEEVLKFKGINKEFSPLFAEKDRRKNKISYEKTKKIYEEYMEFGGFPQVTLAETREQKKLYLNDIFKSYFEKDVRVLADFRDINLFRDTLLLLFQRIGSKVDISKVASEIGATRTTVYSYLYFLQDTYMIYLAPQYSRSVDRVVSGVKKIYACDSGLAGVVSRVSEGALFENSVFQSLRHYGKISYFQKRTGPEIDFILDGKIALEVKETGLRRDYERLSKAAKGIGIKEQYVITKNFTGEPDFIPAVEI